MQLNRLEFEITQAFYGALLAEKMVDLNRESEKRLEKYLQQTRRLYENGLASRLDLLRSEVQLSNIKPRIIESKNNLRMARSSLALLMGRDDCLVVPEGDLKAEYKSRLLEDYIKKALEERPELIIFELREDAAGRGITIARSAAFPQVTAAYNRRFDHPDGFRDSWGESWNFMVNVSLPIFRGFSTYSETARARSRLAQLNYSFEHTRQAVLLEVEEAYYTLIKEEETIAALEKNVRQAEEAFNMAERRYRDGLISNLEFMDTELDYMQARINLLRSKADYIIAKSRLTLASGGR